MTPNKILLDECVFCSLENTILPKTSYVFECSTRLLGPGTKDPQVVQFVKDNDYLLVTTDNRLVIRCIREGVPVAYYDERLCKAFAISVTEIIDTPVKPAWGAPFGYKKTKKKKKQGQPRLTARMKKSIK